MIGFFKKLFRPVSKSDHPVISYVEKHFGFSPKDATRYIQAVQHKSAHDTPSANNERLEFLGDAVLDLLASEYLFETYPNEYEGFLTQKRASIVSRKTLNKAAIATGLEQLVEAKLEQDPKKTSIGGNALEALVGAIYLEEGYLKAKQVFASHIMGKLIQLDLSEERPFDPKSKLIEWTQKERKQIRFETEEHPTKDQYKRFLSEVYIDDVKLGDGVSTSKKKAEQEAALKALESLDNV